jgi:hypothetical protein
VARDLVEFFNSTGWAFYAQVGKNKDRRMIADLALLIESKGWFATGRACPYGRLNSRKALFS